jgi:hypothetical protein
MRIGIFLFLPGRQVKFGKSEITNPSIRHCRIGRRIVIHPSQPPAVIRHFAGACSSMVRAGRS